MKSRILCSLPVLLILTACESDEEVAREYRVAGTHPLASPGEQFGHLPPTVQNTIRAEAGSAEITRILKTYRGEEPLYRVDFANTELYAPLYVAADGSVLHPDLTVALPAPFGPTGAGASGPRTGLSFNELPAAVVNVLPNVAPGAEISLISKQVWGNQVVYVISFKDERHHPQLFVSSDGTVLKGERR